MQFESQKIFRIWWTYRKFKPLFQVQVTSQTLHCESDTKLHAEGRKGRSFIKKLLVRKKLRTRWPATTVLRKIPPKRTGRLSHWRIRPPHRTFIPLQCFHFAQSGRISAWPSFIYSSDKSLAGLLFRKDSPIRFRDWSEESWGGVSLSEKQSLGEWVDAKQTRSAEAERQS